ncbi:MAG: acyl-CoA desaturase [Pseudomonadales bacterium]|nr:acyl-CoA desaturase [Pseudomonadales bacterium]
MRLHQHVKRWFDSDADFKPADNPEKFNWVRCIPFIIMHLLCLIALIIETSTFAILFCLGFFWLRMFAITAFYHRYFSHRSFKTNRSWQFLFAVLGNMSAQRGPLWWAAHHRHHHQHSDQKLDLHSPVQRSFWWSHLGWFTCDASFKTNYARIRDFEQFPELRFINRYDMLVPLLTMMGIYSLGELLRIFAPTLNTNGIQLLVWGFFISTTLLFHSTVTINSLAHCWGSRRFTTKDNSRNNFILALLTLGEGWHNNHHRWPRSAKQGFYWWEIDITYYVLRIMAAFGIIHSLSPVPSKIYKEATINSTYKIGPSYE